MPLQLRPNARNAAIVIASKRAKQIAASASKPDNRIAVRGSRLDNKTVSKCAMSNETRVAVQLSQPTDPSACKVVRTGRIPADGLLNARMLDSGRLNAVTAALSGGWIDGRTASTIVKIGGRSDKQTAAQITQISIVCANNRQGMIAETLVAMPDGIHGGTYAETLAALIEETPGVIIVEVSATIIAGTPGATIAGIAAKHGAITVGGTATNGVKAAGITGTTTAGITAAHSALVAIMRRSAATVTAE